MKPLKSLNKYFIRYKWHFMSGILFVALSTIFKSYQGIIIREGTNEVLSRISGSATSDSTFIWFGLKIIGFAIISGVFMFLMRQTIIVMSRHIEFDQKNEIYYQYQKLDASFFKNHTTGDLMNRISEDVGKVRMYTGPAIMYMVNTFVTMVTVLTFMLNVNPKLTLYVLLPLPFLTYLIYRISNLINKKSLVVQAQLSRITSLVQESFSGIRIIKAYGKEDHFTETMSREGDKYRTDSLNLVRTEALFAPTMLLLVASSTLIVVWYGGKLVIDKQINYGNITEFIYYIFQLTWPFASLGWVMSLIQRASASQQRINEFLDTKSTIQNENTNIYKIKGGIEFRKVSFTYPENQIEALKDISFNLEAGKVLGITGSVGSGKSTLVKLISRMYDATDGNLLIDGLPIKHHNLPLLRRQTGVVPQEVVLFSDTIRNNIAFGSQDDSVIKMDDIIRVSKIAQVHENILTFPHQYETMIGERGVTLSGGQKQRISISRALIHNPEILIFDDCLSAVDAETELLILNELKKVMKGKTSIITSHRVSGIKHADLILYLRDGKIIEQGTHDELIAQKGYYFKLNQLQGN